MKFQPLEPWIMGNESITPINFYGNFKPCMEMGAFIGLDGCCDLYLANKINMGNLRDSWIKNKEYIERVCEITGNDADCGYGLEQSCFHQSYNNLTGGAIMRRLFMFLWLVCSAPYQGQAPSVGETVTGEMICVG